MRFESRFRRPRLLVFAIGLATLALTAPAAVAGSADLRSQAPTSSLAGTHAQTPADVTAAQAQEAYYSSYGEPAPATVAPPAVSDNADDGVGFLPFALAVFGALVVGIAATSGVRVLVDRRRARLA